MGQWITRGFEGFSQGTFGNAGHNLYVSRAGVLQRIHQYDLNRDGYLDLVFCNSHNHWEKPPVYLYSDPLGRAECQELPSCGALSGAVADLNGDGYDDLVLGMHYDGIRQDLNAIIYFGSPEGWSERRMNLLPAPVCTSVAVEDFNGDGRPDIAFLCNGKVRLFYQSELGYEPKRFTDLSIEGEQLAAADLDDDGCAELVVRSPNGVLLVFWGGVDGLSRERSSIVSAPGLNPGQSSGSGAAESPAPPSPDRVTPLVKVVRLNNIPHLFLCGKDTAFLVPVLPGRQFGEALRFDCRQAMAVAAGDINGDGFTDLVFACRDSSKGRECSWVYWGSAKRFDESSKTVLPSHFACDVAVGDVDGDGCDDIVLCQSHTDDSYTSESFVYRGSKQGFLPEPVRLTTEDARRTFLVRFPGEKLPRVVFVNHFARSLLGNVPVSIYFGGPGGFSPERRQDLPAWGAVEALCCDINDDGYTDVVLANAAENSIKRDPGSYVFLNGPNGLPNEPTSRLPTTRAHGACCADINHDGFLDLVFCGFDNPELLIFYGGPEGFDTAHPKRIRMERDGVLYKEPRWICLADFNNDGWLDLFVPQVASDRSFLLWGGPEGFSMQRSQMLSVWHPCCARAADLNGDGYLDLIVGGHEPSATGPHDSFVYIFWNGPDGLREDRRTLLPANAVNAMAVADFNNDGLLDLFVCSYHDGRARDIDSYLYWNRPGRGFSATDRTRFFTHSASGCVAADFNQDRWIDLAIAYHKVDGDHVGYSAVWWNGPEGFDERRVTKLPTSGPHGMFAVGPGNLMDRGHEEYYVSEPFKLPEDQCVTEVHWDAKLTPQTWAKAQLRFAVKKEDLDPSPWLGIGGAITWFDNYQSVETRQFAGHWVQYRLALGAFNSAGTPRVSQVAITFERGS